MNMEDIELIERARKAMKGFRIGGYKLREIDVCWSDKDIELKFARIKIKSTPKSPQDKT